MDFNFTEEQTMLRDTLARYLADNYDFDSRQKVVKGGQGWNPDTWRVFAEELGILGAPFSEAHGGLGGGAVENMVVMEEMGKALVLEPYLSTVVIGGGALKAVGGALADELIPGIIAGTVRIALAAYEPQGRYHLHDVATTLKGGQLNGHKAVVEGAAHATHLLVTARTAGGQRDAAGVALLLVPADAAGITRRDYLTVHGTSASEVYFENVAVDAAHVLGEDALPLIERVIDEATVAACAEACGVLKVLHASTLDYAKQRKQFGKAIGDFQVIQHRLVDMFMEVEQAVSMTMMATLKLDAPDRAAATAMAKAKVAKACKFVGQQAVQVHGGIGITQELAVGHYFKRATLLESLFGTADHHLARYEALTLAA